MQYANERVVFGRPIGQNQGIAFQLAEAQIRLDAAEAVVQKAAWMVDHGLPVRRARPTPRSTSAPRPASSPPTWRCRSHGGFGYGKEFHVERYFREARLMRIAPISQEMVLNYFAEHVLGLPRSY